MSTLYLATDQALVVLISSGTICQSELHLAERKARCVAVDPLRPELVYCGTFGGGVWRSRDAGRNWQPAGNGIAKSKVFSVAVSRSAREGGQRYEGGFIDHYVVSVLYPGGLTRSHQVILDIAVLAINAVIYAWIWRRSTHSGEVGSRTDKQRK